MQAKTLITIIPILCGAGALIIGAQIFDGWSSPKVSRSLPIISPTFQKVASSLEVDPEMPLSDLETLKVGEVSPASITLATLTPPPLPTIGNSPLGGASPIPAITVPNNSPNSPAFPIIPGMPSGGALGNAISAGGPPTAPVRSVKILRGSGGMGAGGTLPSGTGTGTGMGGIGGFSTPLTPFP